MTEGEGDDNKTQIPPRPNDLFSAFAWDMLYGKIQPIINAKSKLDQAMLVKDMISPDIPIAEFMILMRNISKQLDTTNKLLEELKDKM